MNQDDTSAAPGLDLLEAELQQRLREIEAETMPGELLLLARRLQDLLRQKAAANG